MLGNKNLEILFRYRATDIGGDYTPLSTQDPYESEEELFPLRTSEKLVFTRREYMRQMLNLDKLSRPTPLSSYVATHSAIMFTILTIPFCLMPHMMNMEVWHAKLGMVFMSLKLISCVVVLCRQPSDTSSLSFKVPLG